MLLTPSTIGAIQQDPIRRTFKQASLDLRFAENKSLVDAVSGANLVTFARGGSGTYVGSDGLIKTATTNEPRFTHDPVTGESLGLLVEEQRVNALPWSENFTDPQYVPIATAIEATNLLAPDGTNTATLLLETTATSEHYIQDTLPLGKTGSVTHSVFAKAAGRNFADLRMVHVGESVPASSVRVNLATGAITLLEGLASTSTVSVRQFQNGWYRISISVTLTGANTTYGWRVHSVDSATGVRNYTGDPTKGILIWGAQSEDGAFPTSYIKNTGNTLGATRAADVVSIGGVNFSSWYNASEGTIFTEARLSQSATGSNQFLFMLNAGYANAIVQNISSTGFCQIVTSANSVYDGLASVNVLVPTNTDFSHTVAYAANDLAAVKDGSVPGLDSTATLPTGLTQASIGSDHLGANRVRSGTIKRITYWPKRLPNSTLQTITL